MKGHLLYVYFKSILSGVLFSGCVCPELLVNPDFACYPVSVLLFQRRRDLTIVCSATECGSPTECLGSRFSQVSRLMRCMFSLRNCNTPAWCVILIWWGHAALATPARYQDRHRRLDFDLLSSSPPVQPTSLNHPHTRPNTGIFCL